ncbi:MAG: hypothetical protein HN509_16150 [Halobacteriovoraceae bacterium]|jgi:hypothetical protein|nr:hypothetical protein [Halobacteriovoraceae bacterium]MBT5094368.1 hypothetical protein [Halobacteriovoraceae bacterium]
MNDSITPEHQEFANEALEILKTLDEIMSDLEKQVDNAALEVYSGSIEQLRKAAVLSGAEKTANYCKLCHFISDHASKQKDQKLVELSVSILFDAHFLIKEMIAAYTGGQGEVVEQINIDTFAKRMNWLSEKFQDVDSSPETATEEMDNETTAELDALLGDLGL